MSSIAHDSINPPEDLAHAENAATGDAPLPQFFARVDLDADGHRKAGEATASPAPPGSPNAAAYTYGNNEGKSTPTQKRDNKDKFEGKFRIGLQSFKEKVGEGRWKSVFGEQASFQVTRTPEVDAAVKKIKIMEAYYQGLEKSLSAYAKSVKTLGDVEGDLSRFWLEQGFKETEEHLRAPHVIVGNAQQAVSKEAAQYYQVLENVRNAVTTMVKNAIADASETAKRQETARQEMDGFGGKLQAVFEKVQEKEKKTGKAIADNPKDLKEIETAKMQFEQAKEKHAKLTTQLLDKADMLDAKRTSDIPEQIKAIMRSSHTYYSRSRDAFQPKADED